MLALAFLAAAPNMHRSQVELYHTSSTIPALCWLVIRERLPGIADLQSIHTRIEPFELFLAPAEAAK